ncbi:hypothetical protein PR048_014768 [Dryococelus australis]|uniref:Uncharacterized protein n=1 Tax=Dryococelus australis TaxID=614101 RepID=A0ABQ9HF32_9NEOP|nr:hypothetical protein PR048_014768 [Dryococelus australis]
MFRIFKNRFGVGRVALRVSMEIGREVQENINTEQRGGNDDTIYMDNKLSQPEFQKQTRSGRIMDCQQGSISTTTAHVAVKLCGKQYYALIDTGCSQSCIASTRVSNQNTQPVT